MLSLTLPSAYCVESLARAMAMEGPNRGVHMRIWVWRLQLSLALDRRVAQA